MNEFRTLTLIPSAPADEGDRVTGGSGQDWFIGFSGAVVDPDPHELLN